MLGSIIGALGSLGGGLLGASSAKKQMAMQKEFAQNQLQWKAADAEKAGISKYFAMGAPTASYSPVNIGDYGVADAAKQLGSGIDSQGGAGSTTTAKFAGISAEIQKAQLDGLRIDNDIKRAELASKINIGTQPGAGGIMDREVLSGPEGFKLKKESAPASQEMGHKSFGVSPEVDMYRTPTGWAPQQPQALQEAFENDWMSLWQWRIRNKVLPFYLDEYRAIPKEAKGLGEYYFDPLQGQYVWVPPGGDRRGGPRASWEYLMDRLRR